MRIGYGTCTTNGLGARLWLVVGHQDGRRDGEPVDTRLSPTVFFGGSFQGGALDPYDTLLTPQTEAV